MNTVLLINLAGRSYSLEESGYTALKVYLNEAAQKLEGNPDKEEILKDFDLALAEKCEAYLNATKNVITTEEIEKIIHDMGPVQDSKSSDSEKTNNSEKNNSEFTTPKKLYRIREGSIIGGICTGVAAYLNLDLTIVRALFVVLIIISQGWWILIYFILMAILPVASTQDERAQAFGTAPITANDLLQKAKDGYSTFRNSSEWKRWRNQMKEEKKYWQNQYYNHSYGNRSQFFELMGNIMGFLWFAFLLYIAWFGYNHIAPIHQAFDYIGTLWQHLIQIIADKIHHS